jgi:hypothetical protein
VLVAVVAVAPVLRLQPLVLAAVAVVAALIQLPLSPVHRWVPPAQRWPLRLARPAQPVPVVWELLARLVAPVVLLVLALRPGVSARFICNLLVVAVAVLPVPLVTVVAVVVARKRLVVQRLRLLVERAADHLVRLPGY